MVVNNIDKPKGSTQTKDLVLHKTYLKTKTPTTSFQILNGNKNIQFLQNMIATTQDLKTQMG
ncbi:hypothetical protein CR513_19293, partial [Mucuna pruriens]